MEIASYGGHGHDTIRSGVAYRLQFTDSHLGIPMSGSSTAAWYDNLASLLSAGMSVTDALEVLGGGAVRRRDVVRWRDLCTAGMSLSEAMHQTGASALEIALVEAGEKTGRLPERCRTIATYYRLFAHTRRTVVMLLTYPLCLLHLALIVWKVPTVVPEVVSGSTSALFWLLTGPVLLWTAIGILWLALRMLTPRRRSLWSMHVPLWSTCYEAWGVSNAVIALGAALKAGMLVPQALELAARSCGHAVMAERLLAASAQTLSGQMTLASALVRAGFPAACTTSVDVGERSGQLEAALDRLASDWQEHFTQRIATLATVCTSCVYGVAVIVAVVVIITFWSNYVAALGQAL